MLKTLVCSAVAGMLFTTMAAQATPITVPNYDFSMPGESSGGYSIDSITDWAGSGGQYGVQSSVTTEYPGGVPVGNQFAYANDSYIYLNSSTDSAFTQTIQAGTYVLTAEVGNRADYAFNGSAVIGIWAGLGPADDAMSQSAPTPGTWTDVTMTDVVSASDPNIGDPLTILLSSQLTGGTQQVDFNDVTLSFTPLGAPTGVPEPTTLSLFGIGFIGAAAMRRRKKSKHVLPLNSGVQNGTFGAFC